MSPEQTLQQAQCRIGAVDAMVGEAARLGEIAARLMLVQRCWNAPDRQRHLADALTASRTVWHELQASLAEGRLNFPPEVQHNLLILSVYADSKISACEASPGTDALGSLIALTRTVAGSLKEWREAA